MIGTNGPITGLPRSVLLRCAGGSSRTRMFWIVRKFSSYFSLACRLLIPPASTSRRTLVHLSMSVITHFPRDPIDACTVNALGRPTGARFFRPPAGRS